MKPNRAQINSARKALKKQNLKDAKSHFKYKIELESRDLASVKQFFIKHRYRSWKEKGINGDYYTKDWYTYWFRTKEAATHFMLSMK